jgi:1,4-alpha-glucan branching enzyme
LTEGHWDGETICKSRVQLKEQTRLHERNEIQPNIHRKESGMNLIHDELNGTTETITFRCPVIRATSLCLIGDFNNWNGGAHPMKRQANGSWLLEVPLTCGRHYYQFLVDGEPALDPETICTVRKVRHSMVSLIALSGNYAIEALNRLA